MAVRTLGQVVDPAQFNEIAIARRDSYIVKLRDIGYAEDSEEEATTAARMNGDPAVTLTVNKQSGENTVTTADGIKDRLKTIEASLPPDIHIEIINDQSLFIKSAVHSLEEHLIEGSLLAAVVIYFFLADFRATLISAIAIPTSIISTFTLMALMKFDLNQITMLALTLIVGIVIDDAIIVLENIYRFMEEKGMSPMEAAIQRHSRDRISGDGNDAIPPCSIFAHRVYGWNCRALYVLVRLHRVLCHRRFPTGFFYNHADAQFAFH